MKVVCRAVVVVCATSLFACSSSTDVPWQAQPTATPSGTATATPTPAPGDVTYATTLTIDGSRIGPGSHVNFPVLVNLTEDRFRSVRAGGNVARADGLDIHFRSGSASFGSSARLEHEIEYYNPDTGHLIAWVRLPMLTGGANVPITVEYGDATVDTPQNDPQLVWDATFLGVWHLGEDVVDGQTQANVHLDATGTNAGTQIGNSGIQAIVGLGQDLDGNSDTIDFGDVLDLAYTETFSVSGWTHKDALGDALWVTNKGGLGQNDEGWAIGVLSGRPIFDVADGEEESESIGPQLDTDTWYHIVVTWEFTDPVRFWIDGQEYVGVATVGDPATINAGFGNMAPLTVGSLNGAFGFYDGKIDELRIENVRRSNGWIQTSHTNQRNPDTFMSVGTEIEIPINN